MTAGIEPTEKSVNLIDREISRSFGIQINTAHPLQHQRVVGKNRRQKTCGGRLQVRSLDLDRFDNGRSAGGSRQCPEKWGAMGELFASPQTQLLRAEFSAFIQQAHVPTGVAPATCKN